MLRADLATHLHTVTVGQADIENGDVRARGRDAPVGLLGGPRLADDFEVVFRFEQFAHAATHHFVVIEEEHSHRHVPSLACPVARGAGMPS